MAANAKIRILLADEDALRRDGLAAVLSGRDELEVVSRAADGESALEQIRTHLPDIAVVDLNLPKVHGIELVRRVRAESLGTKVIIVSGAADDEIVREVIRAGGDGYLLKNGPARHLFDAISYVQDGGQYFSPHLGRDGRGRHLLEEPARTWEQPEEPVESDERPERARTSRNRRRRSVRPINDTAHLRERLREEAPASDLDERDYEIMTMMADGIRPILDRLEEIDTRVAQMEVGDMPVPTTPRGWLNSQLADTIRDPRSGQDVAIIGRSVNDLEARLPALIEDAVTKRFHQMAGKLQEEIEETHVRTLETFVRNIQVKLVQRVSALEHDMSKQAEAMGQLREYSQRTEDNLSRLISGVDKLAQELPRRLAAVNAEQAAAASADDAAGSAEYSEYAEEPVVPEQPRAEKPKRQKQKMRSRDRSILIFWGVTAAVVLLVVVGWVATRMISKRSAESAGTASTSASSSASSSASGQEKPKVPAAYADTKTKMASAQEFVDRKEYATAEEIYRQVVKAEPNNADALKALASVLYRQDKIDESAAVLDKLTKN